MKSPDRPIYLYSALLQFHESQATVSRRFVALYLGQPPDCFSESETTTSRV
jgi:hypothetical protein